MIDDEVVKKYNLAPPGRGGTARDASVIFKLASQLKPQVIDPLLLLNEFSLHRCRSKRCPSQVMISLAPISCTSADISRTSSTFPYKTT